jgi:hypothetical protein
MEVFDAVRTVLAVREFQDNPVPPDAARRILQAARLARQFRHSRPATIRLFASPKAIR